MFVTSVVRLAPGQPIAHKGGVYETSLFGHCSIGRSGYRFCTGQDCIGISSFKEWWPTSSSTCTKRTDMLRRSHLSAAVSCKWNITKKLFKRKLNEVYNGLPLTLFCFGGGPLIHFGSATLVVWYLTIAFQLLLAIIIFKKKTTSRFPSFSIFVFVCLARKLVLLYLVAARPASMAVYAAAYFSGSIVIYISLVAVCNEVRRKTFGPLDSLPDGVSLRLFALLSSSIVVTILTAFTLPASWMQTLIGNLFIFERTADGALAVSLIAIVVYARRLGLQSRSQTSGLTAGLIFYLTTQLIMAHLRSTSWLSATTIQIASEAAYLCTLLFWIRVFLVSDPAPVHLLKATTMARVLELDKQICQHLNQQEMVIPNTLQGRTLNVQNR